MRGRRLVRQGAPSTHRHNRVHRRRSTMIQGISSRGSPSLGPSAPRARQRGVPSDPRNQATAAKEWRGPRGGARRPCDRNSVARAPREEEGASARVVGFAALHEVRNAEVRARRRVAPRAAAAAATTAAAAARRRRRGARVRLACLAFGVAVLAGGAPRAAHGVVGAAGARARRVAAAARARLSARGRIIAGNDRAVVSDRGVVAARHRGIVTRAVATQRRSGSRTRIERARDPATRSARPAAAGTAGGPAVEHLRRSAIVGRDRSVACSRLGARREQERDGQKSAHR